MENVREVFKDLESHSLDVQVLHAAEYGDISHLESLLNRRIENGEDWSIDVASNYLWTPLFMAAKQGHADCVKLLLGAGAVVDGIYHNKSAWTPLWVATYAGHEQCVKILLENGANVEAKFPETPLFVAARESRINCLRYLIQYGANQNVADRVGRIPIHMAAFYNLTSVATELVKGGCKVDVADKEGITPLIAGCLNAERELVEILLKAGADHTRKYCSAMHNDFSPIHICAARSKTACIEALWKFGAKLNVRTGSGILPKDLTPDSTCRNLILRLEGTVRSLKDICRLKLRKCVPCSSFDDYFKETAIPRELLLYLKFEEPF